MEAQRKHGREHVRHTAALLALLLFLLPVSAHAAEDIAPAHPEINAAAHIALAECIAAKTGAGAPYGVRLAMAAVLLNRLDDARYPNTVSALLAREDYRTVAHGNAYRASYSAVRAAIEGMDITGGATAWARADTREASQMRVHLRIAGWVFGDA